MRKPVALIFPSFSARFESSVPFMYLDVRGLVTAAIGNYFETIAEAQSLPFIVPEEGGRRATRDEIADDYRRVHARQDMRKHGGWAFSKVARLRLGPEGIAKAVQRDLATANAHLCARFRGFEEMCSDAQLLLLSLAWACGNAFRFPKFSAHVNARNWAEYTRDDRGELVITGGAAKECLIDPNGPDRIKGTDDDNPGVIERNAANLILACNAERVQADRLDPEPLYWPRDLARESTTAARVASTSSADLPTEIVHPDLLRGGNERG